MPYLSCKTNKNIENTEEILKGLSKLVVDELGKPESYVMVSFENCDMLFAGNNDLTAFIELKSLGFPKSKTGKLSAAICSYLNKSLDIKPDRIYINFHDIERSMWGWNSSTF